MSVFNLGRTKGGMERQERVLMKRLPGRANHTTALKMSKEKSETKSKGRLAGQEQWISGFARASS